MPIQPRLNFHEWFGSKEIDYLDAFDDCCPLDCFEELEILKKYMVKGKSPGAKMLLKRMEALDDALLRLFEDMDKFNPHHHHNEYQADLVSRRYIYIKVSVQNEILHRVQIEIEKRIRNFNLNVENTRLYPEPNGMAEARAWRRNFHQEQAKEAHRARAAQKGCSYRSTAHGPAALSHPKPVLKVKTGTGS